MNTTVDKIVYPGSDQYSAQALQTPGTIPIGLGEEPLLCVSDIAYIRFEVSDLEKQKAFLEDFGLRLAYEDEASLYFRGVGSAPYVYVALKAEKARFLGAGFVVEQEEDLQWVAQATSTPVEDVDGPGGGRRVRLTDPDGFTVDLVWGREQVARLPAREERVPVNLPRDKPRVNQPQRVPLQPSAIERLGHFVIMVSDFETSWAWYRKHLGLLPSDVLCTDTGLPVLAFCRLDLGAIPADHHTVVLAQGPSPAYMHSAFETLDIDAIGQGQQYLKWKGWKHFWGIGRHILGSQIFDYWLDPHGFEVEHYADGDVFDCNWATRYHLMDRGGLWAWGEDLPAGMAVKPRLSDLKKLIFAGPQWRRRILSIKKAMGRAPRPWLK